jgi:hypothetical protein
MIGDSMELRSISLLFDKAFELLQKIVVAKITANIKVREWEILLAFFTYTPP